MQRVFKSKLSAPKRTARSLGLPTYFTGKPCPFGHITERSARTGKCKGCLEELYAKRFTEKPRQRIRNNSFKQYRDAAIARGDNTYWPPEVCLAGHISERYVKSNNCVTCVRGRAGKCAKENKERTNANVKAYAARHPDREKARRRRYLDENPEASAKYRAARRAREKNAGGSFTIEDVRQLFELQQGKCVGCYKAFVDGKFDVDHVIPLTKGGRNDRLNIQLLCSRCNGKKAAKDPIRFANELGRLL